MRVSQYRQRIEVLEATLGAAVEKQAKMEKLVDHMQLRISATEQHCSWTTDQFVQMDQRLLAQAPRPPLAVRWKEQVLYPVVRRGIRVLFATMGVAPGVRDRLAFRLFRDQRPVYNKLRQISPATFSLLESHSGLAAWRILLEEEERLQRTALVVVTPLRDVPNTRDAVEANAVLRGLPRPLPSVVDRFNTATDKQDETLKEVTHLAQVQAGVASVSFVVFIQGQDDASIDRTLQSVFRQTDPSWELLLCAGQVSSGAIESWLDRDWRIRRISPQGNEIKALLHATTLSTSTFMGLLSPGDVVDDDLVKRIGQAFARAPELEAIYTDEARRTPDGNVGDHFYKPDWSPEHQLSVNMLGRFLALRKRFLLNLPLGSWCDVPAAEYLLTLRLVGQSVAVAHLDDVMYLRGALADDTHSRIGGRFWSEDVNGVGLDVQRYLRQTLDAGATVVADPNAGALRVRWSVPAATPVTLVILTNMRYRNVAHRGEILMVLNFVQSIIEKSSYPNYKIIVVDDGFVPEELSQLLHRHGHSTQTYRAEGPFSFAGKSNFASSLVPSGVVVLLNDDLEVIAGDWIEALVEQASRPDVGVVGGKLLFPDETIQHAGISIGLNGSAGHVFMGRPAEDCEYGGYASIIRNYGAVTGALMAYRKEVFDSLGGFDEIFRVDYNDIDFCLRCVAKGYRVVFTPYAKLYHFHNSTFNRQHDMGNERAEFLRRWQGWIDRDPFCGAPLVPICKEYVAVGE